MHSLIIFASGRGSNAKAIIDYFKTNGKARVSLIVSNKADAGVLEIAKEEHIPFSIVNRNSINETLLLDMLKSSQPSLIIVAGFLWKIPEGIINEFRNRIINIHPALLPAYGGKGMYGHHVHNAVLAANEKESGITIHYVDEVYDSGDIIVQARCPIRNTDNSGDLAARIHLLEHFYYPRTVEFLLEQ